MYDVISVGSACVDVFAKTNHKSIKATFNNHKEEMIGYPSGSKILMKKLDFFVGGGGTNTAVAFSRLGLHTAYLGNIGHDDNGRLVRDLLKKEKIEFIGTISENMTNYSVILDNESDDRAILVYKDASEKLNLNKIDSHKFQAKWVYFCAMELKVLEQFTKEAHKKNINIAFNPSSYLAEKGLSKLKKILERTTMLILNEDEAKLIAGNAPITILLHKLSQTGPKIVVITTGPKGASVYYNDHIYDVDSIKTKVVETTGAGDAFGASFLAGVILQNSIIYGLKLATINATSVIKHVGAKNKLLTLHEADKLLKKHNIKIKTVNLKN